MSEREHDNQKQAPMQDDHVMQNGGLVDVFDDEETRRFRLSDLDPKHQDEEADENTDTRA